MLHLAVLFLVMAGFAALFAIGGVAFAQALFVVFIILALVAFVLGRKSPL